MTEEPTTEAPMVSRETFNAAVIAGDLSTIEAFFAQPHIRLNVEATNAYVIETAPDDDASTFTLRDGSVPWFRRPKRRGSNGKDDVPLVTAARRGHLDVIQWFFSHERAEFMGATLALLLPLVAGYDMWYQVYSTDDPVLLDTLLSSPVFCDYFDDERKQSMLQDIASLCQDFQLINVAIAHGARVNETLTRIAQFGTSDNVTELVEAGAFLVGAQLVQSPYFNYEDHTCATSFLKHGADWGSGPAKLLRDAAADADERVVHSLLGHGFVDVDARDRLGTTALMHVSSINPAHLHQRFVDPTLDIARSLLDYCDVNLTDGNGRTALHNAVDQNRGVAELLLAAGADVAIRDHDDYLAIDYHSDDIFRFRGWPRVLKQFLDGGVDPFTIPGGGGEVTEDGSEGDISNSEVHQGRDNSVEGDEDREDEGNGKLGRSLYDRLLEVEGGLEFIKENPGYFRRD